MLTMMTPHRPDVDHQPGPAGPAPAMTPPVSPGPQLPPGVTMTAGIMPGTSGVHFSLPSGVVVDLQAGTVVGGGVSPFHIPANLTAAFGTAHNDIILGNSQPDFLAGGAGNDILMGRSGGATFEPGSGNDQAIGAGTNNTVDYLDANGPVRVDLATHIAVKAGGGVDQLVNINNIRGPSTTIRSSAIRATTSSTTATDRTP